MKGLLVAFLSLFCISFGYSQINISAEIIQPNCDSHPFIYGEIDITVTGGILPYTYLWSGTSPIDDPITDDQVNLKSGTYSVVVTDSEGTSATAEWEITNIITVVDVCDSNKIDIKLIGATYYSTYNLEGTVPQDNSTIEMPIFTGQLGTGLYCVKIETPCETIVESRYSWELINPDSLILSNTDCSDSSGQVNGGLDIDVSFGAAPYTYYWEGPSIVNPYQEDQYNLDSGIYSVTVTDNNGCQAIDAYAIAGLRLEATVIPSTCGENNGSIDVNIIGGQMHFRTDWSGPGWLYNLDHDGLCPGTYSLTVTDGNGCTVEGNWTVDEIEPPTLNAIPDYSNCEGIIDINPQDGALPYIYTWEGPSIIDPTAEDQSGLTQGLYKLTMTDDDGCTIIEEWETETLGLLVDYSTCSYETDNIDIELTPIHGIPPYIFLWTGQGISTPNAKDQSNISPGDYEVLVRDSLGCEIMRLITVPDNNLNVEVEIIDPCRSHQHINIHTSGGVPPYTYNWEPKQGIQPGEASQSYIRSGDYIVTVIDDNGCELIQSIILLEQLRLNVETTHPSCPQALDGSITLNTSGGTPPYQFQWEGPNLVELEQENQNNLMAGTYRVTITDSNGCIQERVRSLRDPQLINLEPPHLCLVTTEEGTGKKVLLWENPIETQHIEHFNIYRENTSTGAWDYLSKVEVDSINSYVDQDEGAILESHNYHIRSANRCTESEPSNIHRTFNLEIDFTNDGAELEWELYEGAEFTEVRILRGDSPSTLEELVVLPATLLSYTDLNPPAGDLYYQIEIVINIECNTGRSVIIVRSNLAAQLTTSVSDLSETNNIYPNPFSDHIILEIEKGTVEIIDINGRVIGNWIINSDYHSIDTSAFHPGIYFIKLTSAQGQNIKTFVKH